LSAGCGPPQVDLLRGARAAGTLRAVYHHDWSEADAIARSVLAEHGGVAPKRAFIDGGLTKNQLAAVFRRGILNRPRKGWYSDPELPWQANRGIRVGGMVCCVTAAALAGLPVPPGSHEKLHVEVAEDATRLRHNRDKTWIVHSGDDAEVLLHRRALHDPAVWRTSLVDTLLGLAWCVPLEWFVAALDAALHRPRDGSREPLLSEAEYERFAALLPERFRPALDLIDPKAESVLETLIRLGLVRRRIGPFESQFRPTPYWWVDFLVHGRLIVEADGRAFHEPEKDSARDAELAALGYRVLRFFYEEIVFDIEGVLDRIEAALVSI
jgi:very-short-patch-repair endonuclease